MSNEAREIKHDRDQFIHKGSAKFKINNEFNDDYFKIDSECHMVGDMSAFDYFPGVRMWWKSIANIARPLVSGSPQELFQGLEEWEAQKNSDPEMIIKVLDKYGVDIACIIPESMMDSTGYSSRWVTNGEMAKFVDKYPDRLLYAPNLSPIKFKGVKNTIWEMEYWVKEKGARIFKYYAPEDTYINDPDLWPFYQKAEELGIVLCIHTGACWCAPGKSKYTHPELLEDVAVDFPDLKINAFHMGYPHCETLNLVAMQHPNVYVNLTLLCPWAVVQPKKFAQILGEAMRWVGSEKILWGSDMAGFGIQMKSAVVGVRDFQIPEDMQEDFGYAPITSDDRRKIFGENLGRLLDIDTSERRINKP